MAQIGANVTSVQGDVSNLDDLHSLYKEVETKKGKPDVLFANAGIVEPKPTAAVNPEHYNQIDAFREVSGNKSGLLPLCSDSGSMLLRPEVAHRRAGQTVRS